MASENKTTWEEKSHKFVFQSAHSLVCLEVGKRRKAKNTKSAIMESEFISHPRISSLKYAMHT